MANRALTGGFELFPRDLVPRTIDQFLDGMGQGGRQMRKGPVFGVEIPMALTCLEWIGAMSLFAAMLVLGSDRSCGTGKTGMVIRALFAGDEALHPVAEEMGEYLGWAVANLVGVLNVQQIRVAGRMSCFDGALLGPMRRVMQESAHPVLVNETKITLATLGADIVVQGVAALILSREMGLV